MRIILTGGGTGGHIFPLIAVARALKKEAAERGILNLELIFIGPKIENLQWQTLFHQEGIKMVKVPSAKLRRYFSLKNIIDALKLPYIIFMALIKVFWYMPEAIFSKGGYGSLAVVMAGRFYRVPIFIHESDSRAGLVNKKAAKFAKLVFIGFKKAADDFPEEKIVFSGIPIRKEILQSSEEKAIEFFHTFSKKPVILFIGGSQGAEKINNLVLESLEELLSKFEVIHLTGTRNFERVCLEAKIRIGNYEKKGYHPFPFLISELGLAYSLAKVVVSRAGASGIYEIAAWGKPSILIPLPIAAQDHQQLNAYEYAETGAALVLEEQNLTPHILLQAITDLMNPATGKKMSEAARKFAKIDADKVIARMIFDSLEI